MTADTCPTCKEKDDQIAALVEALAPLVGLLKVSWAHSKMPTGCSRSVRKAEAALADLPAAARERADKLARYDEFRAGYEPMWCAMSLCSGMGAEMVSEEFPVFMCKQRHVSQVREMLEEHKRLRELLKRAVEQRHNDLSWREESRAALAGEKAE